MIISNSKNFVFIHLEKTGGTSIEFALDPILSSDDIIIGSTSKGEKSEGIYQNLWKHSSAMDIRQHLGNRWDSMYKFATVRDPYQIMVSLYYYCETILSRFIQINDENITRFFNTDTGAVISWKTEMPYMFDYYKAYTNKTFIDGFIQSIIKGDGAFIMSTQLSRLGLDIDTFDIATIGDNWPTILNTLRLKDISLGHVNKSNKPKNIKILDETVDLIFDFFKEDYENIPALTKYRLI